MWREAEVSAHTSCFLTMRKSYAIVAEHCPIPAGQEDGYSLEGFDIPTPGITLEIKAS